jgi:eukaryotic-like serine/threonine-protein kinase
VKLIDMGLARMRHADSAAADLTASGVTLGTFDYISPEQARDPRNADIRSDIYSLGCTFFFMLAGRPPFPEGTVLQKLLQHQGDEPPDIREIRSDLPEEASRALRKMMAKDPRRRYAGPAELVADLLLLAEQIGLRPMSPTSRIWLVPREPAVSFLHRHLPWIAPVAALVCIVLLLDVFWSSSAQREDQLPPVAPSAGNTTEPATRQGAPAHDAGAQESARWPEDGVAERGWPAAGEDSSLPGAVASARVVPPPVAGTPAPLIVCEAPEGKRQFSTLGAACAAARDGDVIELRFNGPREDRPATIANLRLTIRAGEGYRPIVVFRPTDVDPVRYPHSMFTLTAGQLTLTGVTAELHVPRGVPADDWSLLETRGGEAVRLERCALVVSNASDHGLTYHQDVAFFRVRAAPDAAVDGVPAATPLATVELTDCIARGEADFLRVEDVQPVRLTWNNGLLISTERLLAAGGSHAVPKFDEMVRIELRHVTAVVRGGLCRLTSTFSSPHQPIVQIASLDSILIASAGVPLIEQEGVASAAHLRQRFVWNGERNYYQDVDVFWTVRNLDPETPPDVLTFEAWKAYWGPSREDQPSIERLMWKHVPEIDRPLHSQGAADYALEGSAFDGGPAGAPGCQIDRLPQLPPEMARPGPG